MAEHQKFLFFSIWETQMVTVQHCPSFPSESESASHSAVSDSLGPHGLSPTRLLCLWGSSGKNIGVGCHSLLQGIFLTQGVNPDLLHCRQILYHLSHQGSPTKGRLFLCVWHFKQYLGNVFTFPLEILKKIRILES